MQGALDLAEADLRYCTIISPIDGTVVARNVTVGQSVAASLQAPVVFSIAQDLTRMQVSAATDESDTGNIKIGTEATFQVDAFPTETFHGRVSAIRLNATTIQNVVTYSTIINFENLDGRLRPGETAYATIPTGRGVPGGQDSECRAAVYPGDVRYSSNNYTANMKSRPPQRLRILVAGG